MGGNIQWHIFAYIVSQVETPLVGAVAKVMNAFLSFVAAPLKVSLVLYIALTGILIIRGQTDEAGSALLGRFLKMAIVVWVLTGSGIYQQYVYDFFFQTLPQGLTNALTSGGVTTIDANAFDTVWTKALGAGVDVWRTLSWHDFLSQFIIVVFWIVSILSTVVAFAIWLISRVILALYIAVGPLLIGLALFPATLAIFERWIGSLISCVILQITTIVLLFIILAVEQQVVGQIALMPEADLVGRIEVLLAGVIFFLVAAFVAFQLPGVASSLSGGLHFHTGSIARAVQSTIGSMGRTETAADGSSYRTGRSWLLGGGHLAVSAVGRGAGAVGRAVYKRVRPSTGGSLSDSD
ncbi:Inner membrane protein of type IV secretion of T-DNA complex, VirB6 [Candidatus Burkholderia verschuerenii]|uniref:Inner membrane protein of type IV secretion of T-DNA complex, VirB6 n=1 Tax=Candidatus Burkholderia verschuerenii TaxID=242163 RepID=A0A0L0MFP5_9BURK|nr:type IV secretion system protein [Candidatus Burkholderia verschuerenii]KND61522.1 Inner membrane protein of type IV secretion of T-DNA complex, VirB6 [Candidatus Burkholderia verschuerenii]